MPAAFAKGFGIGAGLIIAIGAQNAFVLSQGIKKHHEIIIPLICSLCDAILIICGICGMGSIIAANPRFAAIAAWGGALFLFWYGLNAFRSALKPSSLDADKGISATLRTTIATTLGLTLLNPHVYLDTVVLIGGIGSQFHGLDRQMFALGAVTASCVWFFGLSLGGRVLAPVFKRPVSWRILDSLVCVTMWIIAVSLIREQISSQQF